MEHILKEGKISKLKGGDSGETFLVEYRKKKFVLRNYETKGEAEYYLLICKKLKQYGFLPEICYQEGNKILFEYIKGRDCRKSDAFKVAEQVGKICARINRLSIQKNRCKEKSVTSRLQLLRDKGLIDEKQATFLEKRYFQLKKRARPSIAVEFTDVYPENFRLRDGKVYLVDLEGFEKMIKGRGIGKAFLRWFRTPLQRKRFRKGYSSIASTGFLTEEYLQFLYLDFTIFIVSYKLKRRKEINPKDLQRLHDLTEGKTVNA